MKDRIQLLIIALSGISLTILFALGIFKKMVQTFKVDWKLGVVGVLITLIMAFFYLKRSK